MRYRARGTLEERHEAALADCKAPDADADVAAGVTRLHLQGRSTCGQRQALGRTFGLHPLALDDEILDDPDRVPRNRLHDVKRERVVMCRTWWPQRGVIAMLMRDEARLLAEHTHPYLRDCCDQCVIVIDFVEACREMATNLLDSCLSAVNQRMNDIMKAPAVVATSSCRRPSSPACRA